MEVQPRIVKITADHGDYDFRRIHMDFASLSRPTVGGLPTLLTAVQRDLLKQLTGLLKLPYLNFHKLKILSQRKQEGTSPKWSLTLLLKCDEEEIKFNVRDVNEKVLFGKLYLALLPDQLTEMKRLISSLKRNYEEAEQRPPKFFGLSEIIPLESFNYCYSLLASFRFIWSYLYLILDHPGSNKPGKPSLLHGLDLEEIFEPVRFCSKLSPTSLVKVLKYWTVLPLAELNRNHSKFNELPEQPEGLERKGPWVGYIYRAIRKFWRGKNPTLVNTKFAIDIQNLKRACCTVPESFVKLAIQKHKDTISTPFDPPKQAFVGEGNFMFQNYEKFKEALPELIRFVFGNVFRDPVGFEVDREAVFGEEGLGLRYFVRGQKKLDMPNLKACFESPAFKGGQFGYIENILRENGLLAEEYSETFLHSMSDSRFGTANEFRTRVCGPDSDVYQTILQSGLEYSDDHEFSLNDEIEERQGMRSWKESNILPDYQRACYESRVVGIKEPLKVRTITPLPGSQYLGKPLQKYMWQCLHKLDMFALIGKEVDGADIYDLEQKAWKMQGRKWWDGWNSGDFSGATDGVNIDLTNMIFEFVLERAFPNSCEEWREHMRSIIGPQCIWYANEDGSDIEKVQQQNGQMMGSILSFPILCCINLLTYLMTNVDVSQFFRDPHDHTSWKGSLPIRFLNRLPAKFNGDDALFPCTAGGYYRWSDLLGYFGFKMSLGKNQYHEKLVSINSRIWIRKGRDGGKEFTWVPIEWTNMGVLTGQSKLGERCQVLPCWDLYNSYVRSGHDPVMFSEYFVKTYHDQLQECSLGGKLNYFIPRPLGGCGLKHPKPEMVKITTPQACLATAKIFEFEEHQFQDLSFPGLVPVDGGLFIKDVWDFKTPKKLKRTLGKIYPRGDLHCDRSVKLRKGYEAHVMDPRITDAKLRYSHGGGGHRYVSEEVACRDMSTYWKYEAVDLYETGTTSFDAEENYMRQLRKAIKTLHLDGVAYPLSRDMSPDLWETLPFNE